MNYEAFLSLVSDHPQAVILLEGTRQLPEADKPHLTAFARQLAVVCPQARFRTGNASGSDEAFAMGIVEVDAERLEYVLPHKTMREQSRHKTSPSVSLDEVSNAVELQLAVETVKVSPKYRGLIERRQKNYQFKLKADYLIRDTLKVSGLVEASFQPAQIGFFYVNTLNPGKGGTGHTIRVCEGRQVPVVTQETWMKWLRDT